VCYKIPLLFEPDEGWIYGVGIDWAGLAVMRATKKNLEEYMEENIWKPLGMNSTTFSVTDHRKDLASRVARTGFRDEEGNISDAPKDNLMTTMKVKYGGGGGCFSTANDFIKFLTSLLSTATGSSNTIPQILSEQSLRTMLTPCMTDASTKALHKTIASPLAFGLAGNIPLSVKSSFGLGGFLNLSQVPSTGRSAGGMQWGGYPNLFWWFSPADGVCGCYFGQLLPTGDRLSFQLYGEFEQAVLEEKKRREQSKGRL